MLTPEEQAELTNLETEFADEFSAPLSIQEEAELAELEKEFGANPEAVDTVSQEGVAQGVPTAEDPLVEAQTLSPETDGAKLSVDLQAEREFDEAIAREEAYQLGRFDADGKTNREKGLYIRDTSRLSNKLMKELEAYNLTSDAESKEAREGTGMFSRFVEDLAAREGTVDHDSLEGGKSTGAFGIKHSLGLSKKEGESVQQFAIRLAKKHFNKIEKSVPDLDNLPEAVVRGLLDVSWNAGKTFSNQHKYANQLAKLSPNSEKYKTTLEKLMKETLDVVSVTQQNDAGDLSKGGKFILLSLGKRRAEVWNQTELDDIAKVKGEYNDKTKKTTVEYLDADGNVVFSHKFNRRLARYMQEGDQTVPKYVDSLEYTI